jgi:hypothetical protein
VAIACRLPQCSMSANWQPSVGSLTECGLSDAERHGPCVPWYMHGVGASPSPPGPRVLIALPHRSPRPSPSKHNVVYWRWMGAAAPTSTITRDSGMQHYLCGVSRRSHLTSDVDRDAIPYVFSTCLHDEHTIEAFGGRAKDRITTARASRKSANCRCFTCPSQSLMSPAERSISRTTQPSSRLRICTFLLRR